MPPNDQEPRYRLVDSNGNVVGSLFVNADGNVAIQDETATETEFDTDGVTTPQLTTDAVRTETIGAGDYLYAGDFDGADADARLDAALASATSDDVIYLETETYQDARTISKALFLVGSGVSINTNGTFIDASWTLDNTISITNISGGGNTAFTFNVDYSRLQNSTVFASTVITVDSDRFRYTGNFGGDITFNSGTTEGIVDSSINTTVTDNGTNTVGDIA